MIAWPPITEPLLRERQGMSTEAFLEWLTELLQAMPARELDDEQYERAIGYPWERRPGSCLVTGKGVEDLADIGAERRDVLLREYLSGSVERIPLLTYGANSSPERLAWKLTHLAEDHHEALILAGDLEDFDVGAVAQPPVFSSMPATLIPSRGTTVRVAVLFLTPTQFTALWWTELTYLVGALTGITLVTDATDDPIDRVIAFISRWGAFCVDGEPVAMAAIPAKDRQWVALTQAEILDAAARMALGESARARDLLEAAYENPASFMAEHYASFRAASMPFESDHWTRMPVDAA